MWDDTQVEVRNSHLLTLSFDRYSQSTSYVPGINNASWWQHGTVENRVPALSEIISQARNKWGKTLRLSQRCQKEMKMKETFRQAFLCVCFRLEGPSRKCQQCLGSLMLSVYTLLISVVIRGGSNFVYQIWDGDSRCILTGHLIFFISQLVGKLHK